MTLAILLFILALISLFVYIVITKMKAARARAASGAGAYTPPPGGAAAAGAGTPGAAPAAPAPPTGTTARWWNGPRDWFTEYLWTILLVGVGIAIFHFGGLYTPGLHQSDLGSWSWDHWLPLLCLWADLIVIIAINAKPLGKAEKWLQWLTAAAAFMIFIGVPTGTWVASGLGITTFPRVSCPAFSPDETRSCVLTEYWSLPITVDRPTYAGEYTFCISVPEGGLREQKLVGLNTYEYRSGKGALPIHYKLFKGGCPVSF